MPGVIDPESVNVDVLPAIWSPVQWELTEDEHTREVEEQSTASLLWAADIPETILRLLLSETDIERAFEPPEGYDPEIQGEWDANLVTFEFKRPIELIKVEREPNHLYLEYKFGDMGYWAIEIQPEKITIERI